MLEKGNKLLIVSKPRLDCITPLLSALFPYRDQVLFRFTIGSIDPKLCLFWEPGAPSPLERFECLKLAYNNGYKTSVSVEPMLGGNNVTFAVFNSVIDFVTDTIWIGKMNKPRLRVDMTNPDNIIAVEAIENMQCDSEIITLYHRLGDSPKVRWKDSIKAVLVKNNLQEK